MSGAILDEMLNSERKSYSVSKICTKCGVNKSLSAFPKRYHNKSLYENTCNYCKQKAWRDKNRDKHLELRRVQNYRARARKAGISLEEYLIKYEERKTKQTTTTCISESEIILKKCVSQKCPILRKYRKLDYLVNKDLYLKKSREQYYKHHEKQLIKTRNYRHSNREKKYSQDKRRAERKATGYISAIEWKELKALYDNCCAYCYEQTKLSQDHFIPLSLGGEHTIDNVVPACGRCNSSKSNKPYLLWLVFIGSPPVL